MSAADGRPPGTRRTKRGVALRNKPPASGLARKPAPAEAGPALKAAVVPAPGVERPAPEAAAVALPAAPVTPALEAAAYLVVGIVAALLRLANLGGPPLSAVEVPDALAAYRFLSPAGTTGALNPSSSLLFTGNVLSMGLFGDADWSARLFVALCGLALVFVPLLYRRWLGTTGALATSFLIAFSPTAVAASRTVSPYAPAVLCVAVALGAGLQWLLPARVPAPGRDGAGEAREDGAGPRWRLDGWLALAAVAAGGALAAGPGTVTALVLLAFTGAAWLTLSPERAAEAREAWDARRAEGYSAARAGLVAAISFLILSTAAFIHPEGLGGATDAVAAWVRTFSSDATNPVMAGPLNPLLLLGMYEPMLVLFGLAGLFWLWRAAARRAREAEGTLPAARAHWAAAASIWLAAALLLELLRPGRAPGEVLWLTVPLAGLGGVLIGQAYDRRARLQVPWLGGALAAALTLAAAVMVVLAISYFSAFHDANPQRQADAGIYPWMLGLGLAIGILVIAAAVVWDPRAWRAVVLGAVLPFTLYALSAAYGLADARATSPSEPWVVAPTSPRVRLFTDVLERLSREKSGANFDVPLTVQASPDGVLGWYLRDMTHATFVAGLTPGVKTELLVAPDTVKTPSVGAAYVGEDFFLGESWTAGDMPLPDVLAWLLVRSGGTEVPANGFVLWRTAPAQAPPAPQQP